MNETKLAKPCPRHDPWPPATIEDDTPQAQVPSLGSPPRTSYHYGLRGSQVEPEAAFWTACDVPCVVRVTDLIKRTDDQSRPEWYFDDYPTNPVVLRDEIDELIELAVPGRRLGRSSLRRRGRTGRRGDGDIRPRADPGGDPRGSR